jgi:hypothetical protein
MKLIAECSFDYQGKTYEYEIPPELLNDGIGFQLHSEFNKLIGPHTDLYAVTCKTDPFPDVPSPKEFSLVRVQRIKPWEEKEFSGDLKKIHHLFFR